ncbi:hypothetical protein Tco_0731043, partial [Tanacetum coccineum]
YTTDAIAQTRFENVYKLSNDSLLARGNTLQSDEDRLKLQELMELCINLQQRVLNLENTKTTQANEIATRVESSGDEESLGEDASKQGRVNAIDDDDDEITLVSVQDDVDAEMFDVALKSVKPKVKGDVIEEPSVPVSAASASIKVSAATTTTATIPTPRKGIIITELAYKEESSNHAEEEKIDEANIAWDDIQEKVDAEYQLAKRLKAEEQEQFTIEEKATLFKELLEQRRKHFAAKRAEENWNKPPTKNMFVDFRTELVDGSLKRVGEELEQESTKKQKVDKDKDTAELQSLIEVIPDEEVVAIDVVPLDTKSLSIVDWKIHKERKNISNSES